MDLTLYETLAAQHNSGDVVSKEQVLELTSFSRMLTSMQSAGAFNDPSPMMTEYFRNKQCGATDKTDVAIKTASSNGCDAIPFDSPFDQSLGSPASSRDFQQDSPVQQQYDFDFSNGVDAPMFPDHGTQQSSRNDNLLSGLPLFGTELSLSQSALSTDKHLPSSQSSATAPQVHPVSDFSFDASTRIQLNLASSDTLDAKPAMDMSFEEHLLPFDDQQSMNSSYDKSSDGAYFNHFGQPTSGFYDNCEQVCHKNGPEALQRALRGVGFVINDDWASIISSIASRSPVPAASQASAQSPSPLPSQRSSVSPMTLPSPTATTTTASATATKTRKIRSSIQTDALANAAQRHGKRFTCPECQKQFDRQYNMRTHLMTHIELDDREKPFVCPWSACNKPFSRKYDAERHYRTVHVRRGECASQEQVQAALSGHNGLPSPASLLSTSSSLFSDLDLANG